MVVLSSLEVNVVSEALLLCEVYSEDGVGELRSVEAVLLVVGEGLVLEDSTDEGDACLTVVVTCGGVVALSWGRVVPAVEWADEDGEV